MRRVRIGRRKAAVSDIDCLSRGEAWRSIHGSGDQLRPRPGISRVDAEIAWANHLHRDAQSAARILADADGADLPVSPHYRIRTWLAQGRLRKAATELQASRASLGTAEKSELRLEKARWLALSGRWQEAWEAATEGLRSEGGASNHLELLQVRALAGYEAGHFSQAALDCRAALEIGEIFPFAPARFYAKILEARIAARNRGVHFAREVARSLWEEAFALGMTPDHALVLCRLEADLARLQGRSPMRWAIAQFRLALQTGETQYQNLAQLECVACGGEDFARFFLPGLSRAARRERDERLGGLIAEIRGEAGLSSTSGLSLRNSAKSSMTLSEYQRLEKCSHIVLAGRNLILHFSPWEVARLPTSKRMRQALRAIAGGQPLTKSAFFRELWGAQKYSASLHDGLIGDKSNEASRELEDLRPCGGTETVFGHRALFELTFQPTHFGERDRQKRPRVLIIGNELVVNAGDGNAVLQKIHGKPETVIELGELPKP